MTKLAVSGLVKSQWAKLGKSENWNDFLIEQAERISNELGELKGSLQKVGQVVSLYGERILPPEANQFLKRLQNQSPPLVWSEVEKILLAEWGEERLSLLEIDRHPVGAASLGQVHRAVEKHTGRVLALKIKYPGVEEAIESDLKILKKILGMMGVVPRNLDFQLVLEEAKKMLTQEADYQREADLLQEYRALLGEDHRFVIPEFIPEWSSSQILAMSFEEGVALDSPQVEAISQERKNELALHYFDLFMKEITVFRKVQTDPHFGNYQIRLDPKGEKDQWVLFDFGALRDLEDDFIEPYLRMLRASFLQDKEEIHKALVELGLLATFEETEYAKALMGLCLMVTEPVLCEGLYDWEKSDLPERVLARAKPFWWDKNVRLPPQAMLSLDRKVGGVFTVLVKLKAKIYTKSIVEQFLFGETQEKPGSSSF